MQTIFYGNSKYVIPIIEVLDLLLIVTTERSLTDPVIDYAIKNQIPYISVSTLSNKSTLDKISTYKTDVAVLADFGLIVPETILNLYPKGIINIHPSLLPKYRGPTPVQTSLLNGDYESGVTLIKLDDQVDHGPIVTQEKYKFTQSDTSEEGYLKLFSIGAKLLKRDLERYVTGEIKLRHQDHTSATYTERLNRKNGYFDISNPPSAEKLDRMIHAYYPWPGAWSKIQKALPRRQTEDGPASLADRKWQIVKFLPEGKIQMEGKKPMSLKDFYNGYPELKTTIQKILKS